MKTRFLSIVALLLMAVTDAVAQTTYKVSMKEGTEDADKWQGKAGEGNFQALPLEGVVAGTAVSVKYSGTMKVKSVKAKKKASGPVAYTQCPDGHHPHWIDLGLPNGTLWQCCNEGATAPENYGNYYNYDDAMANTNVTPPTKAQIDELLDGNNTTSEWTTLNNVNGRWFTSKKNGGKVFLPAAGYRRDDVLYDAGAYGNYWSSTLYEGLLDSEYGLDFRSDYADWHGNYRYDGHSVRPVR